MALQGFLPHDHAFHPYDFPRHHSGQEILAASAYRRYLCARRKVVHFLMLRMVGMNLW